MPRKFPNRSLNKPLEFSSPADEQDVYEVKSYLNKKGFYDTPDYGLTPYPDNALFDAIKDYQRSRGLTVDGVMKVDGETQESMRIEKEELPPPVKLIPGTNIPDKGVPESGWPRGVRIGDPYKKIYEYDSVMEIVPEPIDGFMMIGPKKPKEPKLRYIFRPR